MFARFRRLVAPFWLVVACHAAPPPARPAPAPPPPPKPLPKWSRFDEVLGWPPITPTPFPVQGHLGTPRLAQTYVSPDGRALYLGLVTGSELPDGSVVAMVHEAPDGERRGPVYVMQKSAGSWAYRVLDGQGQLVGSKPAQCRSCHERGVADELFGPPHPAPPPAAGE